jgi:flagellar biosynthesis/type III secretory pathway chaperone
MAENSNPLLSMTKEEVLYQLLKKQAGYYSSILEVTKQENQKLGSKEPLGEINLLLKKKKTLLSYIAEIEKTAQPLKSHWQAKRDRSDPQSIKVMQELSNLDRLLKEILQLDLRSQQMMEAYMEAIKSTQRPSAHPEP